MTTEIERATARLLDDPTRPERLFAEIKRLADEELRLHPYHLQWKETHRLIEDARRVISNESGGARLLEAERFHAVFIARVDAAKGLADRAAEQRRVIQAQSRIAITAGGAVSQRGRDDGLRDALLAGRQRIESLWPKINSGSESDFAALLDDIAAVAKNLTNAVGIARRESRIRAAAAEADAAVQALREVA